MDNFNESHQHHSTSEPLSRGQDPTDNVNYGGGYDDTLESSEPSKTHDQSSHSVTIQGPSVSYNEESTFTSDNLSPSPQDSPILNHDQQQYLGNNFFNDDKLGQSNEGDRLFDLTPDQQQAFRELELRKQLADFDDDYEFALNYDQAPEYDVREKLQSLNAQLANEPLPPDAEHRNSKVVFRDEIVSLVAPPQDYDQSEGEADESNLNDTKAHQDPVNINNEADNSYEPVTSDHSDPPPSTQENTSVEKPIAKDEDSYKESDHKVESDVKINGGSQQNEDMVVSRGGKFQLLGADDITDVSKPHSESENDEAEIRQMRGRPTSAPLSKRHLKDSASNSDSVSSTKSDGNARSNSLIQRSNDKSKQQIPRVDKDALRRQQERKKKEEEENTKREEEEQNARKEMNTKSFNAWLVTKQKHRKEEDERKKKEDEEEKEKKEKLQDERKTLAEEKEKELTKKLENDKRKEDKLRQYRLKEIEDCMTVHSKAECRKAFKDWLKKKHKDHQNKLTEEKQKARITRLAMRQCRKSQDLAQAIHQSNSFRYLDFCGYP